MTAHWQDLEVQAPELARLGKKLLSANRVAFLATVRPDGGPRVHPICPAVLSGRLVAVLIRRTPKHRDLVRDPRYVLHAVPGRGDAEFWVEGTARPLDPADEADRAVTDALLRMGVDADDARWELGIEAAHGTVFGTDAAGDRHADRRRWVPQLQAGGVA
jgi:hypothetical protein